MVFCGVQTAGDGGSYVWWEIVPGVFWVGFPFYCEGIGRNFNVCKYGTTLGLEDKLVEL